MSRSMPMIFKSSTYTEIMKNSVEDLRMKTVTPRVSNPYDYVNHIFKRPLSVVEFPNLELNLKFSISVKCGPLSSVVDFSELSGKELYHILKR
jgi:hypothetical protein